MWLNRVVFVPPAALIVSTYLHLGIFDVAVINEVGGSPDSLCQQLHCSQVLNIYLVAKITKVSYSYLACLLLPCWDDSSDLSCFIRLTAARKHFIYKWKQKKTWREYQVLTVVRWHEDGSGIRCPPPQVHRRTQSSIPAHLFQNVGFLNNKLMNLRHRWTNIRPARSKNVKCSRNARN